MFLPIGRRSKMKRPSSFAASFELVPSSLISAPATPDVSPVIRLCSTTMPETKPPSCGPGRSLGLRIQALSINAKSRPNPRMKRYVPLGHAESTTFVGVLDRQPADSIELHVVGDAVDAIADHRPSSIERSEQHALVRDDAAEDRRPGERDIVFAAERRVLRVVVRALFQIVRVGDAVRMVAPQQHGSF